MIPISEELSKEAGDYAFAEFTRPMEILSGLPEKTIQNIRTHIYAVVRDAYIAGSKCNITFYHN